MSKSNKNAEKLKKLIHFKSFNKTIYKNVPYNHNCILIYSEFYVKKT